jgi:hypothetical protein
MEDAFFRDVRAEAVVLSNGATITLPRRYYDWQGMMAHFPAARAGVEKLLPTNKLVPAQIIPGIAILSLVAIDYHRVAEVQPYREFAIMIPVLYEPLINIPTLPLLRPRWFKRFGLYVLHMPVTTQESRDVGVELWGYPKFVAQIDFETTDQIHRCRLQSEGKEIITLEVKKIPTRAKSIDYHCYTLKDGQLLKTLIQAQGEFGVTRRRGSAGFTLGDHPIADELRAAGMRDDAVESTYVLQAQSMQWLPSERLPLP